MQWHTSDNYGVYASVQPRCKCGAERQHAAAYVLRYIAVIAVYCVPTAIAVGAVCAVLRLKVYKRSVQAAALGLLLALV